MDLDEDMLSPQYIVASKTALWLQVLLGIASYLMLDRGMTFRVFAVAFVGFWLCAGIVALRRRFAPKMLDLWFWRWGFIPCFIVAMIFAKHWGKVD